MKRTSSKIFDYLMCIIFIPILILVVIGFILYLPFDYIKYKYSRFYKDYKEKYTMFSGMSQYFEMYNAVKESGLPIEYIRNKNVDNAYGYFVYEKTLLIFDYCLFYDEYYQKWAVVESNEEDREKFCSVEEMVEVMLDEVNEFMGEKACNKAIVLVDLSELHDEYVDKVQECKILLPYQKGKMMESIKEFIK